MNCAVLIPARNEEKTILSTLQQLKRTVQAKDIYVVNDASDDRTGEIVKSCGVNVLHNRTARGKSLSLKRLVEKYRLTERYDAIFTLDADTLISDNFLSLAAKKLASPRVAVVAGRVETLWENNAFVAYRHYVYTIWQSVYKKIFSQINGVFIAPGTASLYRSEVFKMLEFDPLQIIEDFDFTFQTHRGHLGKIVYVGGAKVYTQDPTTLSDYFHQIKRWNRGFMQAIIKHRVPWGGQTIDISAVILLTAQIFHTGAVVAALFFSTFPFNSSFPFTFFNISISRGDFIISLLIDYFMVTLLAATVAILTKKLSLIKYIPLFWFIQGVSMIAFLSAGFDLLTPRMNGTWGSPARRVVANLEH